jgi:hypothetical protein
MLTSRLIWTAVFASLGLWAVYTSSYWYKPKRRWAPARKVIFACDLAFAASCWLVVAGLVTDRFHAWMFAPLGAVYATAVFFPCYFASVNRVKPVRRARNVLFVLIALACFAVALGILPTSYIGLQ